MPESGADQLEREAIHEIIQKRGRGEAPTEAEISRVRRWERKRNNEKARPFRRCHWPDDGSEPRCPAGEGTGKEPHGQETCIICGEMAVEGRQVTDRDGIHFCVTHAEEFDKHWQPHAEGPPPEEKDEMPGDPPCLICGGEWMTSRDLGDDWIHLCEHHAAAFDARWGWRRKRPRPSLCTPYQPVRYVAAITHRMAGRDLVHSFQAPTKAAALEGLIELRASERGESP